ncbi:MAG: 16S rRNA (uracil(1498)-N(3))-methyltransferase [Termitinemataceae bacterium]|nr:MAG: 16S rRNA (uracil(1498)-N(3))-methyltransferase [Termitinemataceae bacterium]
MKQFIIQDDPDKNGIVFLRGKDYKYLRLVRRMHRNDTFDVVLSGGKNGKAVITNISNDTITIKVEKQNVIRNKNDAVNKTKLILFQSMPKGRKLDLIVRQAAEVGISQIVPFFSEHSVVQGGDVHTARFSDNRLDRLQRIVKEALQQSGSKIDTTILPPKSFCDVQTYWKNLKEQAQTDNQNITGLLIYEVPIVEAGLQNALCGGTNTIVFAVGPEGGFSNAEAKNFMENGFFPITLGENILRVETAALYAAAAIKTTLGHL